VIIKVTHDDIADGEKANCKKCPVALAINRATGKLWAVHTTYCYRISDIDSIIYGPNISLEKSATDWIYAFDAGGYVEPFSFNLEIK